MNTAADILTYAKTHDINLNVEDGQLKIDAPETALTDDFLESAKRHKSDLLLFTIVSDACVGLDMTPEQFIRILNGEAKKHIISGELSASKLKNFAKEIDESIKAGVVKFITDMVEKEFNRNIANE